ncbi:MAG: sigma-70 family RNA polymerase sigma factor [Clostridia bacterium]|nr:sigma-70 family RNA polymerase sigma factor [Clostridia bacterium]
MSEDKNLINKCRRGSREAFNELVLKYQDRVVGFAYNMLSNREDAYDAAQEVFIRVYKNIRTFEEKSSFDTWLFKICSNVCKDFLRKRQVRAGVISIDTGDYDESGKEIEDSRYTPEGALEKSEAQRQLRMAMSLIKAEYREVIVYCDIYRKSYEETAKILKCPVGTIKSRLSRARIALKNRLEECGDVEL